MEKIVVPQISITETEIKGDAVSIVRFSEQGFGYILNTCSIAAILVVTLLVTS
jgi:hypothetical protein